MTLIGSPIILDKAEAAVSPFDVDTQSSGGSLLDKIRDADVSQKGNGNQSKTATWKCIDCGKVATTDGASYSKSYLTAKPPTTSESCPKKKGNAWGGHG